MNILIFSWRGPKHPNWGGAEIVTHEYAKTWVKAGHKVTLFTASFPGAMPEETIDGIRIIRRGNQIVTIQITAVFWYLFSNHLEFDLVVDQFHGIPFFTPLYVKSKKLAFIHEVAKEVWWTNNLAFPVKYLYGCIGYFAEPVIFLLYRSIPFLTVSKSTEDDLINWNIPAKNITVIHNGFSQIFVKEKKELQPTLIFLGAIAQDKGIEDALATFSMLAKENQSWKFWIVGRVDPKYLLQLRSIIDRIQIKPQTKFWGFVDEETKFKLLARAHVMINSSHREGWGLVNIEANSVGTPVVAFDVPGCRDSILNGKTGLLCKRGDTKALVVVINRLMSEPVLYKKITDQAKSWSKTFLWDKSTKESLELIESLTT